MGKGLKVYNICVGLGLIAIAPFAGYAGLCVLSGVAVIALTLMHRSII